MSHNKFSKFTNLLSVLILIALVGIIIVLVVTHPWQKNKSSFSPALNGASLKVGTSRSCVNQIQDSESSCQIQISSPQKQDMSNASEPSNVPSPPISTTFNQQASNTYAQNVAYLACTNARLTKDSNLSSAIFADEQTYSNGASIYYNNPTMLQSLKDQYNNAVDALYSAYLASFAGQPCAADQSPPIHY